MYKKLLSIAIALAMLMSFAACGAKEEAPAETPKTEAPATTEAPKTEVPKTVVHRAEEPKTEAPAEFIDIDTFSKVKMITAKILACEKVEKSDKLLKSTVDVGNGETRTVLSGIAKWYKPEEMVGKTVIMVANLPPRKMKGIESQGMLLCAEDSEGNLKLLTAEEGVAAGAIVG